MRFLLAFLLMLPVLAWGQSQAPQTGSEDFALPAEGKVVRTFSGGKGGWVIQGNSGDPVLAIADGEVIYAGQGPKPYGNLLIVRHEGELLSVYAHNRALLVQEGSQVRKGQKIAEMGDSGADRAQLGFELRRNGRPIDPESVGSFAEPRHQLEFAAGADKPERDRLSAMTRPQSQRDSASSGQSSLPRCTAAETDLDARRHNCFGTVTSPDGSKYVGEFRDGRWNGQGTFTWSDGTKYVGEWRDDKAHGQGTWTHPNGEKYVGEFRDGWFYGQGTFTWRDGEKYVGEYRDDLRHGQGILYGANGSIVKSGRWESGLMVQEFALDTNRFPFNAPVADVGKADRDRLVAQTERRRQQELEQKLAAETRARERLAAEAEAERKKRQELEEQLAKQERPSVSPPPTASVPRNPHALVIGNAAYPGSGRLDNPINDAQAISQKLRAMGFTVTVVNDADRQRLVQAMSQFRKSASAADLSLLFYSGHGVQIFGTNYILPIDADQSDVAQATIQGISLNSVVENFLPGKTKIVFLDACRDNPLQRAGDRSVSKGLAPISVAQGTLISYATKDGQTASDGVGQKNSPFTTALLQHLSDPEDIGIILRKVREKVMAATGGKQQPWEYGSLTGGALVLSAIKATK